MAKLYMLWICLFYITITHITGFSRAISLGGHCNLPASCSQGASTRCRCDNLCSFYNDCCVDAYREHGKFDADVGMKISCLSLIPNGYIYVINKCPNSWTGFGSVRKKCEILENIIDPLMSSPVTNTATGITYRNRYCAECNGDNTNDLSSWSVILACNSLSHVQYEYHNITEDFILHSIVRVGNKWGVQHWNNIRGKFSFYQCDISFSLPSYLSYYVRTCYFSMVSECAFDWDEEPTRQWCQQYMSVVFDVNGQAYRNLGCAVCNRVPLNYFKCNVEDGYIGVAFPDIKGFGGGESDPTLNFAILLDVNPKDGDRVGIKSTCLPNQIFDPFTKKCRSLVCALPGFVRKNNKCVRQ